MQVEYGFYRMRNGDLCVVTGVLEATVEHPLLWRGHYDNGGTFGLWRHGGQSFYYSPDRDLVERVEGLFDHFRERKGLTAALSVEPETTRMFDNREVLLLIRDVRAEALRCGCMEHRYDSHHAGVRPHQEVAISAVAESEGIIGSVDEKHREVLRSMDSVTYDTFLAPFAAYWFCVGYRLGETVNREVDPPAYGAPRADAMDRVPQVDLQVFFADAPDLNWRASLDALQLADALPAMLRSIIGSAEFEQVTWSVGKTVWQVVRQQNAPSSPVRSA